ncbi:MAG: insulinase family protein [Myxococcales bacterium]|nr:insulinase family protein [Myxococcales bacterium]
MSARHLIVCASMVALVAGCPRQGDGEGQGRSSGGQSTGPVGSADASAIDATNAAVADAGAASEPFPTEPPTAAAGVEFRLPAVRRTRLTNGVSLALVEHRALPVLHVRVILRGAGALFDPRDRPGLASITASLLREGATGMDSRAIAAALDGAGASLDTDVGDDAITLSLQTLPERAEATLSLVGKLLSEPTFPVDELDRLRRRELDRLAQEMAEPAWLSFRPFYRAVYGEAHPYSRFDTTPAALRAMQRSDVVGFHRDHVKGGAITVVAVGAITSDAFSQLAQRAFGAIAPGEVARPTMPAVPAPESRRVFIVDRAGSAQAYVRVGRIGVRRNDPSWAALTVANQVLGASPSSRLFVDLRERRSLTYGVYSRVSAAVDQGVVSASGSTRLERCEDFVTALLEHLDRMGSEPVAADELTRARTVVQNRLPTSIATAGDLAARVAELELFSLGDDYFDRYRERVAEVSSAAVREVGQRYYGSATSVIVVVGPARQLRAKLARFGAVTVLRPAQ